MHSKFLKHETCLTENLWKLRETDIFSSKLYFKVSSLAWQALLFREFELKGGATVEGFENSAMISVGGYKLFENHDIKSVECGRFSKRNPVKVPP